MSTRTAQLPFFGAGDHVVGIERAANETNRDTAQTCARMARIIELSARHPDIQAAAAEACAGCGQSRAARAQAIFNWIRQRVRFEQDEAIVAKALLSAGFAVDPDAELLVAPWILIGMPTPCGDCDDFSMLSAAMLAARGVPSEITVIAADPREPSRWSHVYVQVILENGQRLAMDASHTPPGLPIGWEAPRQYRKRVFATILPMRSTGLHGLGAPAYSPVDEQVIEGRTRGRGGVGIHRGRRVRGLGVVPGYDGRLAGPAPIDAQVLRGQPRAGLPGLGDDGFVNTDLVDYPDVASLPGGFTAINDATGTSIGPAGVPSAGSINWGSLVQQAVGAGLSIAKTVTTPAGTYYTVNPKTGQITYQQGGPGMMVGSNLAESINPLYLIGGVGLVLLMMLLKR